MQVVIVKMVKMMNCHDGQQIGDCSAHISSKSDGIFYADFIKRMSSNNKSPH